MAKTKISEFDANPANNTDINSINIAEGCAPSGINNAIRQLMADLKDQQDGTSGDPFTVGGALTANGSFTANGATVIGSTSTSTVTINAATLTVPTTLALSSTGAVKMPVGTTAERPTASTGQIRYNSTLTQFEGYGASSWGTIGGGATGGGSNQAFYENDVTITDSYTITTSKNAMTAGPITINDGITVTVPSGSNWTVI
jgi:hypothetical protein